MKLLVVDDSAVIRSAIAGPFRGRPGWEVHMARDGAEGLRMCRELRPDVVTLDINMPVMDGLSCLAHIMAECPTRVIMVSSLTSDGASATLEAMYMGAVDYLAKPQSAQDSEGAQLKAEILAKIEAALAAVPRPAAAGRPAPAKKAAPHSTPELASGLVLVGCSTGGPRALETLLAGLPADLPWPLVIAQHIPRSFTGPLAERLDQLCALSVREVRGMVQAERGYVYLARGDSDLLINKRSQGFCLVPAPNDPRFLWHPSVERMVRSALQCSHPRTLLGVQLTGMGDDGAAAFAELRKGGGHTVAESPETTVINGMPGALVARGGAERVLPLPKIAACVAGWLR